jgi:hypothetical protein
MIPKKQEPTMLNDNRSISLIDSFGKLFSEALADRLALLLKLMFRVVRALNFNLDNLRAVLKKGRALILYNFELKIYKGQVGLSREH